MTLMSPFTRAIVACCSDHSPVETQAGEHGTIIKKSESEAVRTLLIHGAPVESRRVGNHKE